MKLPREYVEAWLEPVAWSYEHKLGKFRTYGDRCIYLGSVSTLSYGFIKVEEKSFFFSCKVKPVDMSDHFGLLLKSDSGAIQCIILAFDKGMQRAEFLNLPMEVDPFWEAPCTNIGIPKDAGLDGIRVCEKPFPYKDGDVIDIKVAID